MNPKVKSVKALPDYQLDLTFSNGERRVFDVKPYLSIGVFKQLRVLSHFNSARVVAGSVEWAGEIDLSYDSLYVDSKPSTLTKAA